MSALVNLINVSKATNCKIKFPYWKLPITSDKSVHPSPYETYLQDTYNNDLNGKPHTTNQPQFSGQFRNQLKLSWQVNTFDLLIQEVNTCQAPALERTPPFPWMLNYPTLRGKLSPGGWAPTLPKLCQGKTSPAQVFSLTLFAQNHHKHRHHSSPGLPTVSHASDQISAGKPQVRGSSPHRDLKKAIREGFGANHEDQRETNKL